MSRERCSVPLAVGTQAPHREGEHAQKRPRTPSELVETDRAVRALLIAGPTASGKSALALRIAEAVDGEIVNADSMQLYKELRIVTARPGVEDERRVPHHLYGVLAGTETASAASWAEMAARAVEEIEGRGRFPIIVGGTGLYFRALVEGLVDLPAIPAATRQEARETVRTLGAEAAHALLRERDPVLADRIAMNDLQRISRGLEVAMATGLPLSDWQARSTQPVLEGPFATCVLEPNRSDLVTRIDARFDRMMADGALEEIRQLKEVGLSPSAPIMKSLGTRPLLACLEGSLSLEDAVERGKAETRRYAKRQTTWMKTQMISWERPFAQYSESIFRFCMSKILLTG